MTLPPPYDPGPIVPNPLLGGNRLKLGVFSFNGSGILRTLPPEHFRFNWKNSLEIAQMTDALGLEAIVPGARFRSVVGPNHHSAHVFENFTWTSAVAARTSHSCVMSTVHVTNVHPVLAAKAMATIDHIANGRFGLNIVCGWFQEEQEMFGIGMLDHDERYVYADEWITVIKRLWSDEGEFDFEGKYITVRNAQSQPKPLQRPRPVLMNAGGSPQGRAFVARHCDMAFVRFDTLESMRAQAEEYRRAARAVDGREIQVWTIASAIQGATMAEARQTAEHYIDYADEAYIDLDFARRATPPTEEERRQAREKHALAGNGHPIIGDAEAVAAEMQLVADAGVDGLLLTFVDYRSGLEKLGRTVLPLLEQAGLRTPRR